MGMKTATTYAIGCDENGCHFNTSRDENGSRTPNEAYIAWTSLSGQTVYTPGGLNQHYCPAHNKKVCHECEHQVAHLNKYGLCGTCSTNGHDHDHDGSSRTATHTIR